MDIYILVAVIVWIEKQIEVGGARNSAASKAGRRDVLTL